jgi:hypothetical protein
MNDEQGMLNDEGKRARISTLTVIIPCSSFVINLRRRHRHFRLFRNKGVAVFLYLGTFALRSA